MSMAAIYDAYEKYNTRYIVANTFFHKRLCQDEEEVWTEFSKDEVEVKDQLADGFMADLLADTVEAFTNIIKLKAARREN